MNKIWNLRFLCLNCLFITFLQCFNIVTTFTILKKQPVIARQRRQAQQTNFQIGVNHPNRTNVIQPSQKLLDYGPWGSWGERSDCSRSCGGGIAYEDRICQDEREDGRHTCIGASRRHFSCNVDDCPPNSKDFRTLQCEKFNSKEFNGNYHSWIPYYKTHAPCELNCKPKDAIFYALLEQQVIDGTRCRDDGSNDVCVDGRCMAVGCDKLLGSTTKMDECDVCGGDGSSCRTSKGVLNGDNFVEGYNDILLIPAGASSILIQEIVPTNNYFALRNAAGVFFLNGNWQIENPREIKIAGTVFKYERKQWNLAPEKLRAKGPTNESIYVMLMYQEKNLGISYEFSIPVKIKAPQRDSYDWIFGDFGECSRTCGGGIQYRSVSCIRRSDRYVVDEGLCNSLLKPSESTSCNTKSCPSAWQIGEWSDCSHSCGGGTQFRRGVCHQWKEGGSILIADEMCEEPKPLFMRACNVETPCPNWVLGEWTECEDSCNSSTQSRQTKCMNENGMVFLDDACDAAKMPEMTRPCPKPVRCEAAWYTSEWSECDRACGNGNRTRKVKCSSERETLNPSFCEADKQPVELESCNLGPCEEVKWVVSEWSECEASCNSSIQSGQVHCESEDGTVFADDACDAAKMPELTKPCPTPAHCEALWNTSEWAKTIECDKVMGSYVKADECGVCGGNGSSCTFVRGVFEEDNFELGYNDILRLPVGATNILIRKVQPSHNYLALRNAAGVFYLNGNWRIEFPREIKIAGTIFHYERRQRNAAPEVLRARGPTNEPIFVVLLYQEKNLGISYEYSIINTSSVPESDSYKWIFGEMEECSQSDEEILVNVCELPKDEGPCDKPTIQWYYNKENSRCEQFYYGGCKGNTNRFESRRKCEKSCLASEVHEQDICRMPQEIGNCAEFRERWFFDYDNVECHRFMYSGCDGNENNFASFVECEKRCSKEAVPEEPVDRQFKTEYCFLNQDPGSCNLVEVNWYYDAGDGVCKEFYYGGCKGNQNRFKTRKECETSCFQAQDVCSLAVVKGSCSGSFTQWYYDKEQEDCFEFIFTGCQGNANRFNTKESCYQRCKKELLTTPAPIIADDVCTLPQEPGPCLGYYRMWFYDTSDNICKSFVYGGCEGNGNRFEKRTDCEATCVKKTVKVTSRVAVTYPPPRTSNEDVCRLPVEPGPCSEAHPRWFYDAQTQNCLPFVFGGCGGNKNRFKTSEICLRFCTGITAVPPERRPSVPTTTSIPEPTQCPSSNCANIQCPFGIEESFDLNGCSSCRCSNPCEVHYCPDGSRCAIDVVRTSREGIRTEPVCRRVNKPGICPVISGPGRDCETRCRDDADCRGDHKCCNYGCAMTCVPPEEELLVPATQPEPAHIIPGPNVTEAEIGEPAELPCNAVGWPRPTVTWWRETTMLPLSSRRYEQLSSYALFIRSVAYEDAGEYSCHAHSGIGSGAIFKVTLIIDLQPEPLPLPGGEESDFNSRESEPVVPNVAPKPFEFAPLETRVSLVTNEPTAGAPLQIDCSVKGPSEAVEVTWRHQNQIIEENDRKRLLSNHTLFITKAEVGDGGEYKCNAEYQNSFSTSAIHITVKEASPDTTCIDNPQFSNCEVIVRNRYCNNKFYGKFCCASCLKAGQLPTSPDA